ncbi:hypothetical protein ACMGE9_07740 [Macrococcus sp. EM39E]|uniref:hypothetical protein n=1 Tax=Macrococcus animalis TaxID=3395467 RepID=UPI0039BE2BD3
MNRKNNKFLITDFIFFILSIITISIFENKIELKLIGILLFLCSTMMCIKSKDNKLLLILISIITVINMSVAINDMFLLGKNVANWQSYGLRSDIINNKFAEAILIFNVVFSLFLNNIKKEKNININNVRKNNWFITLFYSLITYSILLYGFTIFIKMTGSNYVSISNPIFEYSVLIWIFIWFYSKNNKFFNLIFMVYITVYIVVFSMLGDRSSVFLYFILFIIIYLYKYLSIFRIMAITVFGILVSNTIGVFRDNMNEGIFEIFVLSLKKGLYIDTVSYSYYTSLAISSLYSLEENTFKFLTGTLKDIFLGIESPYRNLAQYSQQNYSWLYNNYGGIFPSHVYAIGGLLSVVISAILLGLLINLIFNSSNKYSFIYKVVITIYSIRWYLYNPSLILSVVILNTTILLIITIIIEFVTSKKHRIE